MDKFITLLIILVIIILSIFYFADQRIMAAYEAKRAARELAFGRSIKLPSQEGDPNTAIPERP